MKLFSALVIRPKKFAIIELLCYISSGCFYLQESTLKPGICTQTAGLPHQKMLPFLQFLQMASQSTRDSAPSHLNKPVFTLKLPSRAIKKQCK